MTCRHRHVTLTPAGYSCTDEPTCHTSFTLITQADQRRRNDELSSIISHIGAQRDSARDCAVMLEWMLADADTTIASVKRLVEAQATVCRTFGTSDRAWLHVVDIIDGRPPRV